MFSALFRTGGVQLIKRKIKLVLFVEFCVSFHLGAFGSQSVSLAWDGSPDTNVIGYILYSGNASGDYGSRLDVGTNIVTTVSGLIEGNTYYFVITAYNAAGIESEQSNEVKFIVPGLVRMALGTKTNASPRLSFPVLPGRAYALQATTDFNSWVTILHTNCLSNCWVEFFDPYVASRQMRFYRVQVSPETYLTR